MSNNSFFKPTLLYKEFMILDLIEKNKDITQREIGNSIGIAVSMVNNYLDKYEQRGYIKRNYLSKKTVEYFVTKNGNDRRKLLNIWYLKASYGVYLSAKDNIVVFLEGLLHRGIKDILLYGAGEVAEIILDVIKDDKLLLKVVAIIDDDDAKWNTTLRDIEITGLESIAKFTFDGVFVSSYTHRASIHRKLVVRNYAKSKIIQFFD